MKLNAMVNVGLLLDRIRERGHVGLNECAKSAGVSSELINRLLNFNGELPHFDSLTKLLSYLNLTNERLFIPCQPTLSPVKIAVGSTTSTMNPIPPEP
jgi:transcriptional regulator with XRE-family HTH domain